MKVRLAAALGLVPAMIASQSVPKNDPTFHADTQLVQVSVTVHEKNRPVANLTRDDFFLTDRGTARAVAIFSAASSAIEHDAAGPLPPHTFSNRPHGAANSAHGVTIILLDGMNTLNFALEPWQFVDGSLRTDTLALAFARQQVMKFVKAIEPGDRVAVYSLGRTLSVLCDFTNDSAQLQKILADYGAKPAVGGGDAEPLPSHVPGAPGDGDFNPAIDAANGQQAATVNASRAGATIAALRSIADHVAGIPGRKNLIWLTASIPLPGEAVARMVGRSNIAIYPVDARGLAAQLNPRFNHTLAESQMPMREVAEETGGRAFLNNNDLSGAIREAIDDAAVTYTLGFYVDANSLDGKFHDIKIRVKDSAMEVRYPRGYFALSQPALADRSGRNTLERIVLSPLESAEVHLLARVERLDRPSSLSVSGSIDLKGIDLRPQGNVMTGTVELYLIQQDRSGEVIDKVRDKMVLRLSREEYAAYLKSGVFFRKVVASKPNAVTLRVVAGDPRTARMGSLIVPISQVQ